MLSLRVFDGHDRRRPVVEQVGRICSVRVPLYPSKAGVEGAR